MQMLRESSWDQEKLLGAAQGFSIDDTMRLSDKLKQMGLDTRAAANLAPLAIEANSGD